MSKVQLKLVAGKTYACPAFKEGFIQHGDVVTVDENVAKTLLEDGYYDPSNNFHRYFKKVGQEQSVKTDDAGEGGDKDEGQHGGQTGGDGGTGDNGGEDPDQGDPEDEEDPDEGGPHAKKPAPAPAKRARTK